MAYPVLEPGEAHLLQVEGVQLEERELRGEVDVLHVHLLNPEGPGEGEGDGIALGVVLRGGIRVADVVDLPVYHVLVVILDQLVP